MAVELATAYISLVPSFKGGHAAIQKEASQAGKLTADAMASEIDGAGGKNGSMGKAFAGVAVGAAAIFAGAKLLGGFLKEAEEAAKIGRQTEAVLASTGGAAKISAGQVDDLAGALSRKSGVDDDVIASGANVLLTFTKIRNEAGEGNDIFDQGTAIALDMATAMGGDLQGSIVQVGKALNDPIKGMSALSKVGVSFTAEQKEQVEAMIASGDTMGAQKLILAELNTEFAGSAEAGATMSMRLGVMWGDIQEQIGGALMPAFEAVGGWLMDVLPKAIGVASQAFGWIKTAVDYFVSSFTGEISGEGTGVLLFLSRIGEYAGVAWDWIKESLPKIRDTVVGALTTAWDWISTVWSTVGPLLIDALVAAWAWISETWPKVRDAVVGALSAAWDWISETWAAVGPVILDALLTAWNWIQETWPKVRDAVLDALKAASDWIETNWPKVRDAVMSVLEPVWEFVRDTWPKVQETILGALQAVSDWVSNNWRKVGPMLTGAFDGIEAGVRWLFDNEAVLIGVLAAIAAGLLAWGIQAAIAAVPTVLLGVAAVTAGIAAAAAWVAAALPFVAIGVAIAAVVAGFVWAYQNIEVVRTVVDTVVDAVVAAGQWLADNWRTFADAIWAVLKYVVEFFVDLFALVVDVVQTTVDVIAEIVRVGIDAFKKAWAVVSFFFDVWKAVVFDPLKAYVQLLIDVIVGIIEVGVSAFKTAWNAIEAVYTFFRDNVWSPLSGVVQTMKDTIVRIIGEVVSGASTAWDGIKAIYTFFYDKVWLPVTTAVGTLKSGIVNAFETAVDAVKTAWDRLKSIVSVPINFVIGFYNNGIRKVWNAVISKIGLPKLDEIAEVRFAKGGTVPGAGNGDTVPALLTPGEFVITKAAAKVWGPDVLAMLNDPRSTIDPAIFGYAAGGPVKSMDETKAWMQQQAGKPYRFPDVGPSTYDCSGFTSALINFVLGGNPHSRRHSSGSVSSDRALQRGAGDPANGLVIGARPPYMTNSVGALVGHVTSTVGGLNAEATPPSVRVGGNARGSGAMPEQYFMPNFGGLTNEEKGIAAFVKSLKDMLTPDLGEFPTDLVGSVKTLFDSLPGKVFDFLIGKLPGLIVDAVVGVAKSIGGAVGLGGPSFAEQAAAYAEQHGSLEGFDRGGEIRRPGPKLVGEHRPEVVWGSRGEYVQAQLGNAAGGPLVNVQGNVYGDAHMRKMMNEELAVAEFRQRAAGRR